MDPDRAKAGLASVATLKTRLNFRIQRQSAEAVRGRFLLGVRMPVSGLGIWLKIHEPQISSCGELGVLAVKSLRETGDEANESVIGIFGQSIREISRAHPHPNNTPCLRVSVSPWWTTPLSPTRRPAQGKRCWRPSAACASAQFPDSVRDCSSRACARSSAGVAPGATGSPLRLTSRRTAASASAALTCSEYAR